MVPVIDMIHVHREDPDTIAYVVLIMFADTVTYRRRCHCSI